MSIDDIKNCLFEGLDLSLAQKSYSELRQIISFRSYKHEVKTISTKKLVMNRHEDKRFILENRIDTLPWGHYRIK